MAPVRLRLTLASVVGLLGGFLSAGPARAQIAFAPTVSSFPNGVTLNVTPVVSHDRRYVRMTLNPIFNALEGFDTYSAPFAVSNSGGANRGGGGGLGGGGLGGGVGGGAGGGFRNMTINAGMDGVVTQGNAFGQGFSRHDAYASEDASSVLSGNAAYAYSPAFRNDDQPPVSHSRTKPSKKSARTVRSKKSTPQTKP